jgi:hypothetical protein
VSGGNRVAKGLDTMRGSGGVWRRKRGEILSGSGWFLRVGIWGLRVGIWSLRGVWDGKKIKDLSDFDVGRSFWFSVVVKSLKFILVVFFW